jgi:hypothetical protein
MLRWIHAVQNVRAEYNLNAAYLSRVLFDEQPVGAVAAGGGVGSGGMPAGFLAMGAGAGGRPLTYLVMMLLQVAMRA